MYSKLRVHRHLKDLRTLDFTPSEPCVYIIPQFLYWVLAGGSPFFRPYMVWIIRTIDDIVGNSFVDYAYEFLIELLLLWHWQHFPLVFLQLFKASQLQMTFHWVISSEKPSMFKLHLGMNKEKSEYLKLWIFHTCWCGLDELLSYLLKYQGLKTERKTWAGFWMHCFPLAVLWCDGHSLTSEVYYDVRPCLSSGVVAFPLSFTYQISSSHFHTEPAAEFPLSWKPHRSSVVESRDLSVVYFTAILFPVSFSNSIGQ